MVLAFAVLFAMLAFVIVGCASGATVPEEEWNVTFGGTEGDSGWSVAQTSEGGYIITGGTGSYSYAPGNHDVWLIKTDGNGNELWNKSFGGVDDDFGSFVTQTSDNGYIIAGETWPQDPEKSDVLLIKTDVNGNEVWDKTFGGTGPDLGNSGLLSSDGSYIIIGETWSYGAGSCDAWLIKVGENQPPSTGLYRPPQGPIVSIAIDKFRYCTGDAMTVTIDIANLTEDNVTFQWYWGVPQYSIWVPIMSVPIPAGYFETFNLSIPTPYLGLKPPGNLFYVQLLNTSGEVLDADAACWVCTPTGEMVPPEGIVEEINKTIERIELP